MNEEKRGRGRPRKVLTEEELNRPKRPRGRPKKEITEVKPKRPRGRPQKPKPDVIELKRPRGRPKKEESAIKPVSGKKSAKIKQKEEKTAKIKQKNTENLQNFTKIDFNDEKENHKEGDTQGYLKLKAKVANIIDSGELAPIIPAKHLKENLLEKPEQPAIITPPLQNKLNISRSRTPQSFAPKMVRRSFEKAPEMPNKVIVITGATSGMGLAMAKNLAGLGHIVIGIGRRSGTCRDARNEILDEYPNANIYYVVADLSLMSQVKIVADEIATKVASLNRECVDVLIHNAGVDTENFKLTYENREYMWATNYLSCVMLTNCLQPMLDRARDARVITFTTSKASRKTKLNWKEISAKNPKFTPKMYLQTKLADLMFALEYDHRNADRTDLHAYCVDPGTVNTTLRTKYTSGLRKFVFNMSRKHGKTVEQGIETAIYLTLAQKLPQNVVFYANKKPVNPSKFALDSSNRTALWRITERDLAN